MADADRRAEQRLDQPRGNRSIPSLLRLDPDAVGRFAEGIARFLGTGRFLAVQTIIVIVWITLNVAAVRLRWDPYPFILLNLAFSTQAAYAAPLILLAGNRQSLRDRATLEHAAAEADIEESQNLELLEGNREILRRVEHLEKQVLDVESRILARLGDSGKADTNRWRPTK